MYTIRLQRPQDRPALAFHGRSTRAPQLSSALPRADRQEWPLGHGHVRLVEDDPPEQQIILRASRLAGHQVRLSADGSEGYRRATALGPDLILLKVRPRFASGLATTLLLKADPSTSQIPVSLLLRGATLEERLARLLQGAVDCVQGPVDGEALLRGLAIHLALARRVTRPGTEKAEYEAAHSEHDVDKALVRAAQRLIEADLAASRSLRVLTSQVGTHAKGLSRAFRAHTGTTVFEFARNAPLQRARTLLRIGTLCRGGGASRRAFQRGQLSDCVSRPFRVYALRLPQQPSGAWPGAPSRPCHGSAIGSTRSFAPSHESIWNLSHE